MNIAIIGTGYVGLVNAACFAEAGSRVTCYDKDSSKILDLQQGKSVLHEPGLQSQIERNREEGRLFFTTDLQQALVETPLCFLAVSTPEGEDGKAYLGHVMAAAKTISEAVSQDLLLVCKSTVPVGTCQRIQAVVNQIVNRTDGEYEIEVASNPEFLRQGSAVADCSNPDRVIVGTQSWKAENLLRQLYIPRFCTEEGFLSMDILSAELTKYAANSILATRISLINELANLCDRVGADIELVREGVGRDPRIGSHFLAPGCGYGGSCFPKDVKALIATSREHQAEMKILQAVDEVNRDQRKVLAKKVLQVYGKDLKGKTFAMWGLTFKPGTDDLREAPSLHIIEELIDHGATIKAYDPEANHLAFITRMADSSRTIRVMDKYEALKQADALLLVTEWQEFAEPDWHRIKEALAAPRIFDGRNLYDAKALSKLGFICHQIGTGIPTGKPAVKEAVE